MTSDAGLRDSLRLAAKAADREAAGEKLRPAFEKRLQELGYGPGAIAQAFSTLTGPGTVADALAGLARTAEWERGRVVALEYENVEREPALPSGHALKITGVERDGHGIRIRYTIRPPLAGQAPGPRGEARDDCGNTYQDIGGVEGLAGPADCITGVLTMPFPPASRHAAQCPHGLVARRAPIVGALRARVADHALSCSGSSRAV